MSFFGLFGKDESSASKAKDRLKMVLAHERASNTIPYMDDLRADLIAVIQKYTKVKDVTIKTSQNQNVDLLELDIILDR